MHTFFVALISFCTGCILTASAAYEREYEKEYKKEKEAEKNE